jgi:hypothetical protein
VPFFTRIFNGDGYEQAILKYMATKKCSYVFAQGSMDRYFENPPDWLFEEMEGQRKGALPDYTQLDKKRVTLRLVCSAIGLYIGTCGVISYNTGQPFNDVLFLK